ACRQKATTGERVCRGGVSLLLSLHRIEDVLRPLVKIGRHPDLAAKRARLASNRLCRRRRTDLRHDLIVRCDQKRCALPDLLKIARQVATKLAHPDTARRRHISIGIDVSHGSLTRAHSMCTQPKALSIRRRPTPRTLPAAPASARCRGPSPPDRGRPARSPPCSPRRRTARRPSSPDNSRRGAPCSGRPACRTAFPRC